ncbi:MAG TPA: elongation factor G, partial [Vicinamibacteria bacterium]|nr:elongation factor G [Vicinamibacteria bacterium]
HPVDSKDIAFQIAGYFGFKEAFTMARPCLLEPIHLVEIRIPDDCMGKVMGDLSSRRGRPQGMEPRGSAQVIKAEVPLAEMLSYDAELTSMTGGRGSYHMEMDHYDEVPGHLQEKVIAAAKAERGEVKEEE